MRENRSKNFVLPVDISEDGELEDWEQISEGSESDIWSNGIVVVGVQEKIESESGSLPQKLSVLDSWVGHIIIPFS